MSKGQRIKMYRELAHLSQVELADRIGVSKQTLYKYENDIITNIPSDKIEAIAKATNTIPEKIMGWSRSDSNFSISSIEKEIVVKYRAADPTTQGIVRTILKVEDSKEEKAPHLMPIAAHAKDEATAEELEADVDILKSHMDGANTSDIVRGTD